MTTEEIDAVMRRHEGAALSFSGGKDSTACVYLMRPFLDRITVYHVDTGDLLPETMEVVRAVERSVPHFVRIQTDALGWAAQFGDPSDLVPYSSHPIGRALGQAVRPVTSRYDCCYHNVMAPLMERVRADGCSLLIRGTKSCDTPRLAASGGEIIDGIELLYPVQGWSHREVIAYLRENDAPISAVYDHVDNSLDCARCSAWWTEGRAAYLRQYHPALFAAYKARLANVYAELMGALTELRDEWAEASDGQH